VGVKDIKPSNFSTLNLIKMSNFKFFHGNQKSPEYKTIIVEFELTVTASQLFEIPSNYEIDENYYDEVYEKLINDFPDQNSSVLEDPAVGIESLLDVEFNCFNFFYHHYTDENGRLTRRIMGM
jgi:hypothetical protein